jgi:hypothetical protein
LIAAIDWGAAITALQVGELPCSGGERRILQLSASLAAGTTVSLRDTVTGLDRTTPPDSPSRSGTQPETIQRMQISMITSDQVNGLALDKRVRQHHPEFDGDSQRRLRK